ncbi:unnamed protein product, partial [Ectocarpus sp. 12 AP-2014]
RLINSVAAALRGTPYHLNVTPYFPDESPLDPVKYVVETGSADGVILNRVQPNDPRIDYLKKHKFPFALHGRTQSCDDAPYLDFDNTAFASHCIHKFHQNGRRNVLIIGPPLEQTYAQHIVTGAQDAAAQFGIKTTIMSGATSDDPSEKVNVALHEHLTAHPQTDAIICASAPVALGATNIIEKLDRKIGVDIDLAAKEAIPLLKLFRKDIIACHEDVGETGDFLAKALIRAIDEPKLAPMQKLIAPKPF